MNDCSAKGNNAKWSKLKETTQRLFVCEGLTTIGGGAFNSFTILASITLPEGIVSIGVSAFEGCVSLESVTFQSYVYFVRRGAFSRCGKAQFDQSRVSAPDQ